MELVKPLEKKPNQSNPEFKLKWYLLSAVQTEKQFSAAFCIPC